MTDQRPVENDERATRNRGLQEEARRQQDPDMRPPRTVSERTAPEPVPPAATDETSSDDIARLENPPQTDGPRERSNDGV